MNDRTVNLLKLLKKSNKATLHIPADFFDSELLDSNLTTVLNDALNELLSDDGLTVDKELVDDVYVVTVTIKEEDVDLNN